MAGTMENITKMALAEMIQNHSTASRFGYVLSDDGYQGLIDTLYEFFETCIKIALPFPLTVGFVL